MEQKTNINIPDFAIKKTETQFSFQLPTEIVYLPSKGLIYPEELLPEHKTLLESYNIIIENK